jgi:hypothetical protein
MAAPMASASEGKQFKFQLKADSKELYLTSTGAATADKTRGVECSITSGQIACGPEKKGLGGLMHIKLGPVAGTNKYNNGWEIAADNEIFYHPGGDKSYHIALRSNEIWAEACEKGKNSPLNHPDGRSFTPGKAYAVFV